MAQEEGFVLAFCKGKVTKRDGCFAKTFGHAKNLPQADFLHALVLIPLALLFHKQRQAHSSACLCYGAPLITQIEFYDLRFLMCID